MPVSTLDRVFKTTINVEVTHHFHGAELGSPGISSYFNYCISRGCHRESNSNSSAAWTIPTCFIVKTHLPREFANVTFTRFFETVYLSKWLNLFNKHILRVVGVPPRAIQPTTAASPALDERSKASIWMDPCDSPFWKGKLILEWNKVTFSLREHVIFIHVELVECHSLWFVAKAAAV